MTKEVMIISGDINMYINICSTLCGKQHILKASFMRIRRTINNIIKKNKLSIYNVF